MKIKNILLSSVIFLGMATSCTDGLDAVNENGNAINESDYPFLRSDIGATIKWFGNYNMLMSTGGLASGAHLHERIKSLGLDVYAQYKTGANQPNNGWVEDYWRGNYTTWLAYLNRSINTARERNKADGAWANYEGIARIWKVYVQSMFADYLGPTPFSLDLFADPDYSELDKMHADFFSELDDAVKQLDDKKTTLTTEDRMYNGDILKWKRFANTLRFRLAIKLSEINPDLCKQEALAAIKADGGLIQPGDDALAKPYEDWGNTYPYSVYTWSKQYMTTSMEMILSDIGGMPYTGPTAGKHPDKLDPRALKMWATSATGANFQGMNPNPIASGLESVTSYMSDNLTGNADRSIQLITYNEVCFLLAEAVERNIISSSDAGGTAQAWYEKGVLTSFQEWGIENLAAAYLTSDAKNKWGTSAKYNDKVNDSGNSNLEKIVTQRYIAFYPDLAGQIWNDKRRLNLPAMVIPEKRSEGAGKWPMDNSISNPLNYVQRALYPQSEKMNNTAMYNKAITQLPDGDMLTSSLWWASKKANYCTSSFPSK